MFSRSTRFLLLAVFVIGAGDRRPAFLNQSQGRLPIVFEPSGEQYVSRGPGYTLLVDGTQTTISLRGGKGAPAVVRMKFAGATRAAAQGEDRQPGVSHYFIGNDPRQWRTNVPHFGKVRYRDLYPGIDLVYYGNQRKMEYDLVAHPGAATDGIALAYEGVDRLRVDGNGDLVLQVASGELRQERPRVYQERDGRRSEVACNYAIDGRDRVKLTLGGYDRSQTLVIDPALVYSTYFGKFGNETGYAIAVDAMGNTYIAGSTDSTTFTTVNPYQAARSGQSDVFVTKLNSAGTTVLYSTYLGGNEIDAAQGMVVDSTGAVYLSGYTYSTNFPTRLPLQANTGGGSDAFVAKLAPAGNALVFSTYLGGTGEDQARGIAVDSTGASYIAGVTSSADFPTRNPLQPANHGGTDAFIAKLNPSADALVYSTYLGGTGDDAAAGIALDVNNGACVVGTSGSNDFTTQNPAQTAGLGQGDAFVARLNAAGSALVHSTLFGGTGPDSASGVTTDATGNMYVTGSTGSTNFNLRTPLQPSIGGGTDAFVAKFSPTGAVLYSTYLGGSAGDAGSAIALGAGGSIYVAGYTNSTNFPVQSPVQSITGGLDDGFVLKLNAAGDALLYSTYVGGSQNDRALAIATDSANAYVAGWSDSANFPTQNATLQATNGGGRDIVLLKIGDAGNDTFTLVGVGTNPDGLRFTVDDAPMVQNTTFFWRPGTSHTIGTETPQPVVVRIGNLIYTLSGARYNFNNWNDGGPLTRTINVTVLAANYVANFDRQNRLTVQVTPQAGGTVVASPSPGDMFYNAGSTAQLTAVPNPGYVFVGWTDLSTPANPLSVTMDEPRVLTANFAQGQTSCSFTLDTQSQNASADGGNYQVNVTTQAGCRWGATTSTNWLQFPPPPGFGSGSFTYSLTANGGPLARPGSVTVAGQVVQVLQQAAQPVETFFDVPRTHPYFDYVSLMADNHITSGCSTTQYCPDANTTRSQMAVFIVRAIDRSDTFNSPTTPYFTDVPPTHPYFKWVQRFRELNITTGCTPTAFCPDDPVTRGQMGVFIIRGRLAVTNPAPGTYPGTPYFSDVPASHPYFAFIQKMKQLGITSGCTPSAYCPDSPTTRGQMSVFLIRGFFAPMTLP